ncbi:MULTISPECIES: hypothetical protein [Arthrobacter]|nr:MULTISPECIES: hypothetical protein [unclassified Arthrobacter]
MIQRSDDGGRGRALRLGGQARAPRRQAAWQSLDVPDVVGL